MIFLFDSIVVNGCNGRLFKDYLVGAMGFVGRGHKGFCNGLKDGRRFVVLTFRFKEPKNRINMVLTSIFHFVEENFFESPVFADVDITFQSLAQFKIFVVGIVGDNAPFCESGVVARVFVTAMRIETRNGWGCASKHSDSYHLVERELNSSTAKKKWRMIWIEFAFFYLFQRRIFRLLAANINM